MRLGLVVSGGLHPSGREQVVPLWLSLVERLARRHEVHAFVLRSFLPAQSYVLNGAHVHDLGSPARGAMIGKWAQFRALQSALARHGPFDVLHGFWADPAGLVAAAAARRLRIPSLVTFDSGELVALADIGYGSQRVWQGRTAVALSARWATLVHVCSQHMEQLAHDRGLEVTRVPLGIDLALAPVAQDRREGPPWRLLQIASLNRVKDHRTLVEAVARVAPHLDVHLDLVGEDTLGGEIARAGRLAGVADRITFHGFLPHEQLPHLRGRAHLYVQSSRHEASGIAVLEAAAAGLPVAGTRVGYVADWSPDGATAVDVGDAEGLAEAIGGLIGNAGRRQRQAAVARQFALDHDVDWSAEALEGLYQKAVHRSARLAE